MKEKLLVFMKMLLGLILVFTISACSHLKLTQDRDDKYFTVEEYKQTFYKELHSKKKFEEHVRIELKDLEYLDLESLETLTKEKELRSTSIVLTKSYKNIRDIENDKKYISEYVNKEGKEPVFFVYKNNRALLHSSGGDKTCLWNSLDLLEIKGKRLMIISFAGTSYNISPITVFEEEPPPIAPIEVPFSKR